MAKFEGWKRGSTNLLVQLHCYLDGTDEVSVSQTGSRSSAPTVHTILGLEEKGLH